MFVASPHSSSSSWMPEPAYYGGCTPSGSKQRMASYKRKRDGVEAPETVTTCLPSTSSYINEQGKRVRRDAVNGASGMDSACITAKPTVRPPTIDEERAWSAQTRGAVSASDYLHTVVEEPKEDGRGCCSLWMNVQGDVEMDVANTAAPSTPVHSFFASDNCFQLAVSTPTGHPHPYSPAPLSRAELGASYFDLIQ